MIFNTGQLIFLLVLFFLINLYPNDSYAHGGVAFDEDGCVINIDFLKAHFTVYQPESQGNKEFCEDIPDVSNSVFVMEYLHDFLQQMPVDFRIVRDVNNIGQFAKWEDVEAIEDLEAATVFYQPPRRQPGGSYTVDYEFDRKGTYIGVVTAQHPQQDQLYRAVFYFQVGGADLGTIPLFIGLLVLLQLIYWLSSGGWSKMKAAQTKPLAQERPHDQ